MKKVTILVLLIALTIAGLTLFKKEKNNKQNEVREGVQTLRGVISNINSEMDGYSMIFTDSKGIKYETIISIPNLGINSSFNFNELVEGARLEITGEVWDLAGKTRLTAREVKTLEKKYAKKSCISEGGEWRPVGILQLPACIFTYSDGGKSCSSSDECEGYCRVTEVDGSNPQCAFDSDRFGCGSSIEDLKEHGGIICID